MADVKEKLYDVYLNYDEIMLLDGKCNKETQEKVDLAKQEHGFGLDPICNEILTESMKTGKLTWCRVGIRCCKCCDDKPSGYHAYTRSSRYHYKGQPNYDRPFRYSGIQPNQGFLIIEGARGICEDCWFNIYLPKLINYIIENNLPIEIQKNDIGMSKYKKNPELICFECGKTMYESEMGRHETLMGNGTYPSTCPHCGAESLIFGSSHKDTGNFRMILKPDKEGK